MTKTDIEQAITIIKSYKEVGVQDQAKLEEALQTLLSFASSALSQESKVKLSACCQEPVAITTTEEGTNYFTCSKCIRPCDLYIEPSSALEREVCPECGGKGGRSFADRPAVELGWVQCRKCSGTGTLSREAVSEEEILEIVSQKKFHDGYRYDNGDGSVDRELAKALSEKFALPNKLTKEEFHSILSEFPPSIAKDSGQPEWTQGEIDKLWNFLTGKYKWIEYDRTALTGKAKPKEEGVREEIIDEKFGGQITYSNRGMRHQDEEETFYLGKGDKVYIERKKKAIHEATKKGGR